MWTFQPLMGKKGLGKFKKSHWIFCDLGPNFWVRVTCTKNHVVPSWPTKQVIYTVGRVKQRLNFWCMCVIMLTKHILAKRNARLAYMHATICNVWL